MLGQKIGVGTEIFTTFSERLRKGQRFYNPVLTHQFSQSSLIVSNVYCKMIEAYFETDLTLTYLFAIWRLTSFKYFDTFTLKKRLSASNTAGKCLVNPVVKMSIITSNPSWLLPFFQHFLSKLMAGLS